MLRSIVIYYLFYLLLISNLVLGQSFVYSGYVYDSISNKPLPFSNIKILNSSIGTYTDEKGYYQIPVKFNDTLVYSFIGYETKSHSVLINKKDTVFLSEEIKELQPIVIKPTKLESKVFGKIKNRVDGGFLGRGQYALYIKNETMKVGIIERAYFKISPNINNKTKALSKIQVRVYKVAPNLFEPGKDLLIKPIIIDVKPNQNKIEVDLSYYNIPFPLEGVFIGIDILSFFKENGNVLNQSEENFMIDFTYQNIDQHTFEKGISNRWVKTSKIYNSNVGEWKTANATFGIKVSF